MSVVVFANVSLRYLTNFSLTWSEEVARYLMIWMTFLGAGLVLRVGGHVAVTSFQELLPAGAQRVARGAIVLLLLVFFAVMAWMGHDYMSRMRFQVTPATRIAFSHIYAAMPVGFLLMIAHLLAVMRGYVTDHSFAPLEGDMNAETIKPD
ncbi:MAG: TRAP transporter small permease [Rhizobiaceae bacterium]|nr:TRAP transporter small permease [Rhizobiaceae bacterium]MCV0408693.1 TRAP transporter small permease [Rhizobiaceae bacterium]